MAHEQKNFRIFEILIYWQIPETISKNWVVTQGIPRKLFPDFTISSDGARDLPETISRSISWVLTMKKSIFPKSGHDLNVVCKPVKNLIVLKTAMKLNQMNKKSQYQFFFLEWFTPYSKAFPDTFSDVWVLPRIFAYIEKWPISVHRFSA